MGLPLAQASVTDSELQKMLESEIPRFIQRELAENHSLKLIIRYLEEILGLLHDGQGGRGIRTVADSRGTSYGQVGQKAPSPGASLSNKARLVWERNAAMLQKWFESDEAFWVPGWVLEKFCRDSDIDPLSGNAADISNLIKKFLEEGKRK